MGHVLCITAFHVLMSYHKFYDWFFEETVYVSMLLKHIFAFFAYLVAHWLNVCAFCIPGVFSVLRRKGAICMFQNVASPRLHLAIGNENLLVAVCASVAQFLLCELCQHGISCHLVRVSVCLSVRQSVWHNSVLYKDGLTSDHITTPYDSPGTLVFWRQKSRRNSNDITRNGGAK